MEGAGEAALGCGGVRRLAVGHQAGLVVAGGGRSRHRGGVGALIGSKHRLTQQPVTDLKRQTPAPPANRRRQVSTTTGTAQINVQPLQ